MTCKLEALFDLEDASEFPPLAAPAPSQAQPSHPRAVERSAAAARGSKPSDGTQAAAAAPMQQAVAEQASTATAQLPTVAALAARPRYDPLGAQVAAGAATLSDGTATAAWQQQPAAEVHLSTPAGQIASAAGSCSQAARPRYDPLGTCTAAGTTAAQTGSKALHAASPTTAASTMPPATTLQGQRPVAGQVRGWTGMHVVLVQEGLTVLDGPFRCQSRPAAASVSGSSSFLPAAVSCQRGVGAACGRRISLRPS